MNNSGGLNSSASKSVDIDGAVRYLSENDRFLVLTHDYPDGDTLGSAFALCMALGKLGKKARPMTVKIPSNFEFLIKNYELPEFEPRHIISADVASDSLLGADMREYADKIELCIDHHSINTVTAERKLVRADAAANCEIIYEIINKLGVEIDKSIADLLYTGISTDTGCFKYSNTTSKTHKIAAELISLGCDFAYINKIMFDTKSKKKLMLERAIYNDIIYCADDKCAIINTRLKTIKALGLDESELEGLASIPRKIEGVLIGITMREKADGSFKVSVRTNGEINAAEFCAAFGGGGHFAAAGCTVAGSFEQVREKLIKAAEETLWRA